VLAGSGTLSLFGPKEPKPVTLVLHLGARGRPTFDPDGLLAWRGDDRALISFADLAVVEARSNALDRILKAWVAAVG